MKNDGKAFESLVTSISNCLHKSAIITPDDKIMDKHTGRKRQIDISIRISDGPSSFLGIIEARDRSRKVGVDYLEQVKSKRDSVNADKAFIVSNKGFTKTALDKARAYGIELFSLDKALKHDWSLKFSSFHAFVKYSFEASFTISFFDVNKIVIKPHESVKESLENGTQDEFVISDKFGNRLMKTKELVDQMIKDQNLQKQINSNKNVKHPVDILLQIPEEKKLYIKNSLGGYVRFHSVNARGLLWSVMKEYKPQVSQYKNELTGELIAEVLGATEAGLGYELIAEYPMKVGQEGRMFCRKKDL